MCNLGYKYERGYGVAKDPDQAAAWYRKAAKAGSTQAQAWLNSDQGRE
jgi:hypothetical protein